jgi:hypothetical protein
MSKRNNSYNEEFEHWCPTCKCLRDGFGELIPPVAEEHNGICVVCKDKVTWRKKGAEFRKKEQQLSRGGKPHPTITGKMDGAMS